MVLGSQGRAIRGWSRPEAPRPDRPGGRLSGLQLAPVEGPALLDPTVPLYKITTFRSNFDFQPKRTLNCCVCYRPLVPEECRASVQPAQMLTSECAGLCRNGYCTPSGTCCCSAGWEGDFCRIAKCEPACRHGGVCVRPHKCLCKKGYLGPQCEQVDRNIRRVTRAGILDHIIDMTSYLLDLTSYVV
ncbi:Hedgehog-interacting protein [Galemys pyrenaicus]|uniref:Hedgehog-interacting protein n=1 Tax=Galemys pyrenaicus TaxID=202257 RepID=A0A8J6AG47_GALPY|nr:Hedgehog-interacting protein [Galemys pyrenaicus]